MGQLIPEASLAPLLMQAALARQASGYGRGGGGGQIAPTNFDGTPMSRRDIKENFHLRGLQRRAEMAGLSDALHQSRMANVLDSMPTGMQQFAPGGPQTELMRSFAEKDNAASFLDQLRGNQPIDPQVLRNQGLKQLYQGGQLSEDAAGMAGVTPDMFYQRQKELQGIGPPGDGTTVNVGGAPLTIEQQAKAYSDKAAGKPSEWEQGLLHKELGLRESYNANNLEHALRSKTRPPNLFEQWTGLGHQEPTLPAAELMQALREQLATKKADPAFGYTPGSYPLLDTIVGNENATPQDLVNQSQKQTDRIRNPFNEIGSFGGDLPWLLELLQGNVSWPPPSVAKQGIPLNTAPRTAKP